MLKSKTVVEGICPKCNVADLDYGVLEPEDSNIFYPFTCNNCGVTGKEYYTVKYQETTYQE